MEISILVGRKNDASGIPWPAGHTGMHSYRFFLNIWNRISEVKESPFFKNANRWDPGIYNISTYLHNSNGFKWFYETHTLWQKGLTPISKAQQLRSYTLRAMSNFGKFCPKIIIPFVLWISEIWLKEYYSLKILFGIYIQKLHVKDVFSKLNGFIIFGQKREKPAIVIRYVCKFWQMNDLFTSKF